MVDHVVRDHSCTTQAALLVTFLIVGQALASPQMTFVSNLVSHPKDPSLDLCNVCVQFTGQALNELLNIILSRLLSSVCTFLAVRIHLIHD